MRASHQDLHRTVKDWVEPVQTTLRADHSVQQAMADLRGRSIDHAVTYFYVVDGEHRLQGVVPTRRLLLADPEQNVKQIMHEPVVSLWADETLADAMEVFARHRYLALPVVDREQKLVGTISVQLYADEAFDLAETERVADVFQLIGVWIDQMRQASPGRVFAVRMPWLLCNIVGGIACAGVATVFGVVIEQVLVIAAFVPLVLSLGEGISIQSLTLGIQQMTGGISRAKFAQLLGKEAATAALIGLASGALVALAALLWGFEIGPPLAIGASVAATMTLAAVIGAAVPGLLHLMRLDPKIAAGPVVLMTADVCTLTLYLGLATALLS